MAFFIVQAAIPDHCVMLGAFYEPENLIQLM